MSAKSGEDDFNEARAAVCRCDDDGRPGDERYRRVDPRWRHPRSRRTLHRRWAAAGAAMALTALCGPGFGASKLFKCIEGGRTIYQQQACSVTSEPAASGPQAVAKAGGAEATPAAARPALRWPSPASSASATSRR